MPRKADDVLRAAIELSSRWSALKGALAGLPRSEAQRVAPALGAADASIARMISALGLQPPAT
ncbi:MAG TPA: hypothetical protein VI796_01750 [Candidatus Thermoplasmatota archaeon]|nr:hypothetical protein [Candidatus Thermoplasmatota archaeon]